MEKSEQVTDRRARHVRRRVMAAGQLVHARSAHLDDGPRQEVDEAQRLIMRAEAATDQVDAGRLLARAEELADRAYEVAAETYGYDKRSLTHGEKLLHFLFGRSNPFSSTQGTDHLSILRARNWSLLGLGGDDDALD